MPLTRLQRDLQGFAEGKLLHLIRDTMQTFEIAGRERDASSCLIAMFLKAAVVIAVNAYGNDKEKFLEAAEIVYDNETNDTPHPMKGH